MVEPSKNERGQLWLVLGVLFFPSVLTLLASIVAWVFGVRSGWVIGTQVPWYLTCTVLTLLPFFWIGSLRASTIAKKILTRPEGLSVVLSLVPVVVWVFALTLLTRDTSSPYKLELPSNYNWSSENQYRTEYLLSTILSMVTSILVPLILVSATESHDRIMFFGLMKGLAVFFAVIRFGLEMLRGLPNKQFFTFINPLPFIFEAIGSFMVVIALLRLGKSSIPAIAIFLFSFWLVQLMGHTFDSLAIGVGSIGGGIAVWGLMLLHEANERLKKVTI